MTDAPAAFQATFCGFRSVGSRKMTAITMEVPVEHSERVLRILGHPDALNPRWFAIALLDTEAAAQAQGANAPVSKPVPTKDRRSWNQLSYAEQAGIKSEDRAFRRFLEEEFAHSFSQCESDPATFIRKYCEVGSRADLRPDNMHGNLWVDLNDRYDAWMRAAV